MSANPFFLQQRMASETCCSCKIVFAMPQELQDELIKTHAWFYCPKGHSQHYTGKSTEEELREQLRNRDWRLNNALQDKERIRAERDKAQSETFSIRERIKKGRCPASRRCKHSGQSLAEHIQEKHPRYPWKKA